MPDPDFAKLASQYSRAVDPVKLDAYAASLGVSADSLRRLCIGWDGSAWTIPERDGTGLIIGICRRLPSGQKIAVKGSRRGLIYEPDEHGGLAPYAKTVVISEGASDCAAAMTHGHCAVGTPMAGAGGELLAELLAGHDDVVLVGDNNEAGRRGVVTIADALRGKVKRVRVLFPPDGIKDLREWLRAGLTREQFDAAVAAAVDAVPARTPSDADLAYLPFPVEVLPEPARSFVVEASASIGCDDAFVALPLLAGIASAIGNSRVIELKPGWTEPAVIFEAVVGESGSHKTPAQKEAHGGLTETQEDAFRRNVEAGTEYETDKIQYEAALADWRKSGRKDGEPPPDPPQPPRFIRYMVNDTTVEALCCILADNPRGVLIARDELSGFVESFDAYRDGRGGDTAFYLSAHGAGPATIDRKSGDRRTLHIPRVFLCICGGIQPGVLRRCLGKAHVEDGLLPRFLLAQPPRRPHRWTDAKVSDETRDAMTTLYARLLGLNMEIDANGCPCPKALPLSRDAHEIWKKFYNEHGAEMAALTGPLTAVWSKHEAYAARFALIFHLISVVSGAEVLHDQVGADSISAGIALAKWFGREARRVYAMLAETPEERRQREMVEMVKARGGTVSIRELMRSGRRYGNAEDAEAVLEALVEAGVGTWGYPKPATGPGRPSKTFILNPADNTGVDEIAVGGAARGDCVNVNCVSAGQDTPVPGA